MAESQATKQVYRVDLGARAYDIHIEAGCLKRIGEALNGLFSRPARCMVISNVTIAPLYMASVRTSLEQAGWQVSECILPDGERYKTMESFSLIMDALMEARLSRNEPVIALGGGVVGDMTGFAASCYRRGIPFIQIPTTVLAQVDSSVGGKTAINHPHGKNMIGAFYQPRLVWVDPEVLHTLAAREIRAGIAEAIKYGLIRDAAFFDWMCSNMQAALALDPAVISTMIHTCCRHKAEVVMQDETEQGMRALLNLGHTFGHAIESMTRYTTYLHGEAVALGTLLAARLSEQTGHAPAGTETKIAACYQQAGLPLTMPDFDAALWLDAMGHDKKNVGARIRYILLRGIGDGFIAEDIQPESIRRLIASYHA
ncbi:3-dehydroquinate synthase [Mariprofundus ferrooxydans]|uniref:3-dehydroquinate synthase n=1 Tax=Mariprofundus ferrooxydans PV-1 TaxID=314345 RepID=Q0F174_9PROT|nr:3-dehydroquinate synthase [Mariprofundus ferrooxydans]EAU55317.1 3-dehydroquinate synthase [Mariprofundus ferrooxydans PV-1]KON47172.1 3-dehydroquinate synthase [Mariprofundus ferrooxydans]